jgi:hypothetical protein
MELLSARGGAYLWPEVSAKRNLPPAHTTWLTTRGGLLQGGLLSWRSPCRVGTLKASVVHARPEPHEIDSLRGPTRRFILSRPAPERLGLGRSDAHPESGDSIDARTRVHAPRRAPTSRIAPPGGQIATTGVRSVPPDTVTTCARSSGRPPSTQLKPADLRRLNGVLEARGVGLVTRRRLLEDLRCTLRYAVEKAEVPGSGSDQFRSAGFRPARR